MARKKKSSGKAKQKAKKASPKRTAVRKKLGKSSKSREAKRSRKRAPRRRYSAPSPGRSGLLRDLPEPEDQGLSDVASADSESVDELLDEGNAFEAGVVSGVEQADNSDGKEVRTREVPEDDVPGEYLDNES